MEVVIVAKTIRVVWLCFWCDGDCCGEEKMMVITNDNEGACLGKEVRIMVIVTGMMIGKSVAHEGVARGDGSGNGGCNSDTVFAVVVTVTAEVAVMAGLVIDVVVAEVVIVVVEIVASSVRT